MDNRSSLASYVTMSNKGYVEECRACLKMLDKGPSHNLFEAWFTPWAVQGALIADDLAKLADIEISEADELPKFICSQCYMRLTDACNFMINVQRNDSILRSRCNDSETQNTLWPRPILLKKSGHGDLDNGMQVEIKQEVLSEDENTCTDQDWEPTMDIKIEPEEISAPYQSTFEVNGTFNETNEDITNTAHMNGSDSNHCEEYLDSAVKQEPMSGDESTDLPLDCMLCFKPFNSVSGLKAHVIADHSYKSVKRKAAPCPPLESDSSNNKSYKCLTCYQSFKTRTDLMVHKTGCGPRDHTCYVCDAKFKTFRQLSKHVSRCRKTKVKDTTPHHTKRPPKPQQSPPVNEPTPVNGPGKLKTSSMEQEPTSTSPRRVFEPVRDLPWKIKEVKSSIESPPIEDMVIERVQQLLKSWPSKEDVTVDVGSTHTQSEEKFECIEESTGESRKLEIIKVKLIDKQTQSTEEIKGKSLKIEIESQIEDKEQVSDKGSESSPSEPEMTLELIQTKEESRLEGNITEQLKDQFENEDEITSENISIEPVHRIQVETMELIKDQFENEEEMAPKQVAVGSTDKMQMNHEFKNKLAEGTEAVSTLEPHSVSYSETDISVSTAEPVTSLDNSSEQYELSLSTALSLDTVEENDLASDSYTTLQIKNSKITPNTCDNIEEFLESHNELTNKDICESNIEQSFEQKESSTHNRDKSTPDTNSNIGPLIKTKDDISEVKDEISKMKVHLAINPLSKDTELFDNEMEIEEIECAKSESCEPKLVSAISEQSDIEHS